MLYIIKSFIKLAVDPAIDLIRLMVKPPPASMCGIAQT